MNDKSITVVNNFHNSVEEIEHTLIITSKGHRLAARIWLPADAEQNPVPAILEFLPYRKRDGTAERDELTHPYYAGHGYACVRVDMRGSGDSSGVLEGEYLLSEQDEALEVLDWICSQPWCSGNTGIIGISWGGFNGLQIAARRPSSLKAIVTIASTDDRYADDIHYMGGVMLKDNLTWGSTMFAFNSRPPDPALVGDEWRELWMERLKANDPWIIEWLAHQPRDAFWQHGSVKDNYDDIQCAVYAVGGWADGYSNAVPRLLEGLNSPAKGLIGPWAHKYPHFASPGPKMGFLQETLRWWDYWLKGIDTGIMDEPAYRVWMQNPVPPKTHYANRPGLWVAETGWPVTNRKPERYRMAPGVLIPESGDSIHQASGDEELQICSPLSMGTRQGTWCGHGLNPDGPNDQREDDGCSVLFDSQVLQQDVHILGAPALTLEISSDEPDAFVVARLNDVAPDGSSTRVTYGVLNLTHRDSHENPSALVPGKRYSITLQLNDIAQTIPAGHRIRVALSTSFWPLLWPSPKLATLTLETGKSHLALPTRAPQDSDNLLTEFPPAESAPPQEREQIEAGDYTRLVEKDETNGDTRLTVIDISGLINLPKLGWQHGSVSRHYFSINDNDPNSCRMQTHWTTRSIRPDYPLNVRTETWTTLTSSETEFFVEAKIEAYDSDELVYSKEWNKAIPRNLN